jgi:DNA topoisomerase-1
VVRAVDVVTDPAESAKAAGLRHVSDTAPGIRRRRVGRGFIYLNPDGACVRDPIALRRIRTLAIPPAWRDVWICAMAHGHLQAVGRNARGRKQYRYHARWRTVRDGSKYARLLAFGAALPAIRERVDRDLARPGLPREKVLATVVRLLETTFIRVGNEEYAKANGSFGLTTLRGRHVAISGSTVRFEFRGKGGKRVSVDVTDRRLARIVKRCQEPPGQELFQYVDADRRSTQRTSTCICVKSRARSSRQRISVRGPAPCSPRSRSARWPSASRSPRRNATSSAPSQRSRISLEIRRRSVDGRTYIPP